ncbi:MAG TPA: universal stress protein [Acidimicrobiales bacterium]|nr:universal stress protein [Acidimicrobiales bacterium]
MTTDLETAPAHRERRTIVVGVDGSAPSRLALKWAADEAVLRDACLRVVHAGAERRAAHPGSAEGGRKWSAPSARVLDDAVGLVTTRHPDLAVRAEILGQSAPRALVGASEEADLLVVGARGRGGFTGLLLGSVSQQCIQHARCSVAVVRSDPDSPDPSSSERRIVVGVDGSAGSDGALRWALHEAVCRSAVVEAVHAWQFPPVGSFVVAPAEGYEVGAATIVGAARAHAEEWMPGARLEAGSRFGPAVPELLRASEHAELLVLGARGRGGFHELLVGSVGQQCANHSSCPVVVVRDPVREAATAVRHEPTDVTRAT